MIKWVTKHTWWATLSVWPNRSTDTLKLMENIHNHTHSTNIWPLFMGTFVRMSALHHIPSISYRIDIVLILASLTLVCLSSMNRKLNRKPVISFLFACGLAQLISHSLEVFYRLNDLITLPLPPNRNATGLFIASVRISLPLLLTHSVRFCSFEHGEPNKNIESHLNNAMTRNAFAVCKFVPKIYAHFQRFNWGWLRVHWS